MSDFYKIKCTGYKGKMYLFLDEKGFSFKKKKYCLFGEFILVDSFLVSNIKMNKSRSLIRIVDKTVDVIFNDKSLNIKFSCKNIAGCRGILGYAATLRYPTSANGKGLPCHLVDRYASKSSLHPPQAALGCVAQSRRATFLRYTPKDIFQSLNRL